ncbi:hypothetical protein FQN50_008772, partial [Emmonsiellopsis sp. PD_5]
MAQVATGTNRVPISANPNMFETLDQAGSAQSHGGSSYNPASAGPANTSSYAGALHSGLPSKPATAKELWEIKIHSKTLSDLLLQNSVTKVLVRVNKATREKGIGSILGAYRLTGQEVIMVAKNAATKVRAERNTAWLMNLGEKESKIHSKQFTVLVHDVRKEV